jgi:hypothetical protein
MAYKNKKSEPITMKASSALKLKFNPTLVQGAYDSANKYSELKFSEDKKETDPEVLQEGGNGGEDNQTAIANFLNENKDLLDEETLKKLEGLNS